MEFLLAAETNDHGAGVLGSIDGIPVVQEAQFVRQLSGHRHPVAFRHFSFQFGRIVEGEILTNASDADIARILSGLDIAAFQAALPHATQKYVAGAGFVTPTGDPPAAALPPPSVALQAYQALLDNPPTDRDEHRAFDYLAEGEAREWHGLKRLERGREVPVTDRLVSLLGPEPRGYQVQRDARALLLRLGDTLSREERHLVAELASSGTHSQESLRSLPWWPEDLSEEVATLVARLPNH